MKVVLWSNYDDANADIICANYKVLEVYIIVEILYRDII